MPPLPPHEFIYSPINMDWVAADLRLGEDGFQCLVAVPFSAGALPGCDNFVIFEFPDDLDGDVVYVESDTAQRIYEDRNPVRQCTYTFHAALAQALPARESQDLIRTVRRSCDPVANTYPSLDDTQYNAVVNGRYLKSTFSNASGD